MGNIIAMHALKTTAMQLGNRGFDGRGKKGKIGGVWRSNQSGQSFKAAVRRLIAASEIRTAHVELLVDKVVQTYNLTEEYAEAVGSLVCIYGFGMKEAAWLKRKGAAKNAGADHEDEGDPNEKTGAVTIVTNDIEVRAMVDTFVEMLKGLDESDAPDDRAFLQHILTNKLTSGEKARLQNMAEYAIQNVRVTPIQAAGGKMAASGVTGTLVGAVRFIRPYSIDELCVSQDFWTARFSGRPTSDDTSDPFANAVAAFCTEQEAKPGAEGMGYSEVSSNTMYRYMDIDVKEFMRGLNSRRAKYSKEEALKVAMDHLPKWCEGFAIVDPSGKNHTALTRNPPTIVYVEAIKNGMPFTMNFNEVIRAKDGGRIEAQGVQKFLDRANSKAFPTGTVTRYVLLDDGNKKIVEEFEDKFRAAGVQVLHTLAELKEVIAAEIQEMV